jgi:hypothetical protein
MRQHNLCRCGKEECYVCSRGLDYCLTCGGGESSIPKECPGVKMNGEQQDGVSAGTLDYVGGEWVILMPLRA